MNAAAGYRFDFDRFLDLGRIGAAAAIELPSPTATWGDVISIRVQSDEPAELTAWRSPEPAGRIRPLQAWRVDGERQIRWACDDDVFFELHSGRERLDDAALRVVKPAASLTVDSRSDCMRHAPLELRFQLRYAREAYLTMPELPEQTLALAPAQEFTVSQAQWPTDSCGQYQAQLRALGIDGHWRHYRLTLTVLPRPVSHNLQALGNGLYWVEVIHAEPTQLELPLLGSWQPLHAPGFELRYSGLQPMPARLHVRNDAGVVVPIEIELHQEIVWQETPSFSQPIGWPVHATSGDLQ